MGVLQFLNDERSSLSGPTSSSSSASSAWKEHRASFLTTSTCSGMSSIDHHHATARLSSYETTSSKDLRLTETIFEDEELESAARSQKQLQSKLFHATTVRVLKQAPVPEWMNFFVPRFVTLQTGTVPYMEYRRSEGGEVRQRKLLSVWTHVERQSKNKLLIDFQTPGENVKASSSSVSSNSDKWVLKFESKHDRDVWAKHIQDAIDLLAWINKFTLGNMLMHSPASTITECYSWMDRSSKPSFVLKAVDASSKKAAVAARNEIRFHHLLTNFTSHENIVHLHDSFRQKEKAYLILENCAGGDLYEYISANGGMEEAHAKTLFRKLAEAIAYVHDHGIVHLDIKPENVYFKSSSLQVETVKLGDFGSAQLAEEVNSKSSVSCTIGYAAPEVLESGDVSFAADVFSAGAVLYTILCGYSPFTAPSDEEMLEKTLSGEIAFDDLEWWRVSDEAKHLVRCMLHSEAHERLSMEEVLDHPWLQL
ncbi:Camk/cdpk protein kinase, partial [Globisporangium splendens]